MGSNGLPPINRHDVPTSPPAPLPRTKRKVVDGTECSKADPVNTLVAYAMLGMTMDFSMLGILDKPKKQSEGSIDE
jgi:hypothetical protein